MKRGKYKKFLSLILLGFLTVPLFFLAPIQTQAADNWWEINGQLRNGEWLSPDQIKVGNYTFTRNKCEGTDSTKDNCVALRDANGEFPLSNKDVTMFTTSTDLPSITGNGKNVPTGIRLWNKNFTNITGDDAFKVDIVQIVDGVFKHEEIKTVGYTTVGINKIVKDDKITFDLMPFLVFPNSKELFDLQPTIGSSYWNLIRQTTDNSIVITNNSSTTVATLRNTNNTFWENDATQLTYDGEAYQAVLVSGGSVTLYYDEVYTASYYTESSSWSQKLIDILKGNKIALFGTVSFSISSDKILHITTSGVAQTTNNTKIGDSANLYIPTSTAKTNAFTEALASAVESVGKWAQSTTEWSLNLVNSLLTNTENYVIGEAGCDTNSTTQVCGMSGAWTTIRNLSLVLLVMALIIIAFANALQLDIEQYGLNRMIPKIIISIFFAYLSWLIFIFFFDFTTMIQNQAVGLIHTGGIDQLGNDINAFSKVGIDSLPAGSILAQLGAVLLLLLICLAVMVCAIILCFFLIIRVVMLCFLLVSAPLAFILNIVPFASGLYKQWWAQFWKWMFMGPLSMIIIALGWTIATSVSGGNGPATTTNLDPSLTRIDASSDGNVLLGVIVFAASLYMAVQLPLKMGGGIMKSYTQGGKKLGGWLGKTTGVSGAAGIVKSHFKTRNMNREARWSNAIARTSSRGRLGTSGSVIRQQQFDAAVTEAGKQIGVSAAGEASLISRYKQSKNTYERAAIERQMAANGNLEKLYANIGTDPGSIDAVTGAWVQPTADKEKNPALYRLQKDALDDAQHRARVEAGKALVKKMGSDQVLEKAVKDNQAELFVAARNDYVENKDNSDTARYAISQYEGILAGQKNKSLKEKRMNILDEIDPTEISKFMKPFDLENMDNAQVSSAKAQDKYKDYKDRTRNTRPEQERQAEAFIQEEALAENMARDAAAREAAETARRRAEQERQAETFVQEEAHIENAVRDEAAKRRDEVNSSRPAPDSGYEYTESGLQVPKDWRKK